jgi:hypothetical protein
MTTTILAASTELIGRLRLSGSGPTGVTSQTKDYQRVISALIKSNKEICGSHTDWTFLWAQGTVVVNATGNPHTAAVTNVKKYDEKTFYYDGNPLDVIPWVDYKKDKLTPDEWLTTGTPEQVVIQPDKKIVAIPEPNASGPYTINFDYWRTSAALTENEALLDIPDDAIEVLYDRARMLWLDEEESPQYQQAKDDFTAGYKILEDGYWPGAGDASLAEDQEIVVETL